jgi:hypothetical protein
VNQVTNLIQWKNLTQEQKDEFDFENYKYGVQAPTNTTFSVPVTHKERPTTITDFGSVYRLVIEDDKWYCTNSNCDPQLGKDINRMGAGTFQYLSPARPDEIPQPEKTLEQKIQDKWPNKEVVILTPENGMLRIVKKIGSFEYDRPHIFAESMKGFYYYVYQRPSDKSFFKHIKPTYPCDDEKTIRPVAVLFER